MDPGQQDHLEEIARCDEAIALLGDPQDPDLRHEFATEMITKALALGELARSTEEIAIYDQIIERFGDDPGDVRIQVAWALVDKGITLADLDRPADAVASFEEAVQRFGEDGDPELYEPLVPALDYQRALLAELGRLDDAIAVCDAIARRATDGVRVGRALRTKVSLLCDLGRYADAAAVPGEVAALLGSKDPPPANPAAGDPFALLGTVPRPRLVGRGAARRGGRPRDPPLPGDGGARRAPTRARRVGGTRRRRGPRRALGR